MILTFKPNYRLFPDVNRFTLDKIILSNGLLSVRDQRNIKLFELYDKVTRHLIIVVSRYYTDDSKIPDLLISEVTYGVLTLHNL